MVELVLRRSQKKALIMVCYRPSNDLTFVHNFKHALDSINTNNYQSIFIFGDFSFPNINWIDGNGFSNLSTNDENKFVDILNDLFLFQLIDSPTRAHNSKRFWSFFSFKNKRSPIPDKVCYGSDIFSEDSACANAFVSYFQSIYSDHDNCDSVFNMPTTPNPTDKTLEGIQVTVDKVLSLLQSIKTNKSIGPDSLPNIILKECAEALTPSLTAFIDFGLSHGFYLSQWKFANLNPIHKKGKRNDVCNYRPISLLPVISKIQEKFVASALTKFIKSL